MSYSSPLNTYLYVSATVLATLLGTVISRARALGFWLAVCLPWALFVLVASGYATRWPEVFAGLLVATVICVAVGRGHARS